MSEMAIFLGKLLFIIQSISQLMCSQEPENVGIAVKCVSEDVGATKEDGCY